MEELNQFIKSNPDSREMLRALAVKLALQGYPYEWIGETLLVSQGFISKWKKAFEEAGVDGIKLGYRGSKPYLTHEEQQEVIEWIKQESNPSLPRLKKHIEDAYQVLYKSERSYHALLHAADMSWKKAQKTNPKANLEEVSKKKMK